MNIYAYSVVPEEIDFKGRITVPSLCGHIINAIGQNIRKEGFGIDVMAKENRSWILIRSAFEIDQRPALYSPLFVSVWPVSKGGISFYRCIRITDENGKELGRGTTEWCMIDIASRRPIYPGDDLDVCGRHFSLPCEGPRRIQDFAPDMTDSRKVGYSECDFNGHLNNNRRGDDFRYAAGEYRGQFLPVQAGPQLQEGNKARRKPVHRSQAESQ